AGDVVGQVQGLVLDLGSLARVDWRRCGDGLAVGAVGPVDDHARVARLVGQVAGLGGQVEDARAGGRDRVGPGELARGRGREGRRAVLDGTTAERDAPGA